MKSKNINKESRFEKIYSQGLLDDIEVFVYKTTGVNYLFHTAGYAGSMTVLVNKDGKPIVTPIEDKKL